MLQSRYLVRQAHMLERVRWKRDWRNDGPRICNERRRRVAYYDAAFVTTNLSCPSCHRVDRILARRTAK